MYSYYTGAIIVRPYGSRAHWMMTLISPVLWGYVRVPLSISISESVKSEDIAPEVGIARGFLAIRCCGLIVTSRSVAIPRRTGLPGHSHSVPGLLYRSCRK
jgi:hypothetical protein